MPFVMPLHTPAPATCGTAQAAGFRFGPTAVSVPSSSAHCRSSSGPGFSITENVLQDPHCPIAVCSQFDLPHNTAAARRQQLQQMQQKHQMHQVQQAPVYQNVLEAPVSQVRDYLYIGAYRDATNKDLLNQLGITRIINVTKDCTNEFESDERFHYLRLCVSDTWNQQLQEKFPTAFAFIDEARRNNERVLVHCKAGVSRSAAFVIGYLMYSEHLSLDAAHGAVRNKREIISPNLDFMGELKEYETSLRSVCSA